MDISAADLRKVLTYDATTGIFRWTGGGNRMRAGRIAGTPTDGYLKIMVNGRSYRAHRLAWLYVYGVDPANLIDHINSIRDDNRIANLREASHADNQANRKVPATNTSGFKGVSPFVRTKRWRAQASVHGKNKHIGFFATKEEAAAAYNEFITAARGEFAHINALTQGETK
jgi:hypothetical protein